MDKVGFDIHGTIDRFPNIFKKLGEILVRAGVEVHIITGAPAGDIVNKELTDSGMILGENYTHFFSIVDHNKAEGHSITYDDRGRAWIDGDVWNKTKALYCVDNNISLIIDDSDDYHEHFPDEILYCLVK